MGDNLRERDYSLDCLKAFAIAMVFIWHLQPIRIGINADATLSSVILIKALLRVVNSIVLNAVPTFYFVSLLLFYRKLQSSGQYLLNRVGRLLNVFVFWSVVQVLCFFGLKLYGVLLNKPIEVLPQNSNLLWVLFMGGPSFPALGDPVLYFISNLIFLVVIAYGYGKIASRRVDIAVFIVLSLYMLLHHFFFAIRYWRIDNFLIYIPLAHYMSQRDASQVWTKKHLFASVGIYALLTAYEIAARKIFHAGNGMYDLNSRQFAVIALFLFVAIYPLPRRRYVEWLSRYSLGLFCLHKYWLVFFVALFNLLMNRSDMNMQYGTIQYSYIVIAVLTICCTCLTVALFSRLPLLRTYVS
jgi:hypothetical protein